MVFSSKKILLSLILLGALLGTPHTHAQFNTDEIPDDLAGTGYASYNTGPSANDVFIELSPENPGPFQDITLRTNSDYLNLNRYNTTWYVDGRLITSGIGARTITTKTRGYGQRTNIIILIELPDTLIKKTITLEPQDVTMIWEAVDAYVPPFYEGKKLPPREGLVKVVAIPNFKTSNGRPFKSEEGVYRWSRNGNVVATATGYGKSGFTFKNNKIRSSEAITVTASDTTGNYETSQSITVPTFNPKILFYEKNARTGLTSPLSTTRLSLVGDQTTIQAEPFFFSLVNKNVNGLEFGWSMNNTPVSLADSNNKQLITLENPGDKGTALLTLGISSPTSLFQAASARLPIQLNDN